MEETINKIIICTILIFCCYTSGIGQNNDGIVLKYSLEKKEFRKLERYLLFPVECLQNRDVRRIVDSYTIYCKTDTLFIVLLDKRKYVKKDTKVGCVDLAGRSPSKKIFNQFIPIQTEKRIVVLKCNWYTLIFEKKKGNKYKLSKVYEENFFDYINSVPFQNPEDKVSKN